MRAIARISSHPLTLDLAMGHTKFRVGAAAKCMTGIGRANGIAHVAEDVGLFHARYHNRRYRPVMGDLFVGQGDDDTRYPQRSGGLLPGAIT